MGLLSECLLRLPGQRLVELSNADNAGGLRASALSGTVTVTSGSLTVVGAGTSFTSFQGSVTTFGGVVIQFASQPGVNYVVSVVTDDTHLTLLKAYGSVTTAGTTASLPGINYTVLQQAVFDAQVHFQTRTNYVYDDVTQNAVNAGANPTLNKCIWAAVALVIAYMYDPGRGHPWPEAEVEAAWRVADTRLRYVLANYGDGAFAQPVTDSVYSPSVGPTRLPTMDSERFGDLSPNAPGPGPSDVPGGSGSGDWSF